MSGNEDGRREVRPGIASMVGNEGQVAQRAVFNIRRLLTVFGFRKRQRFRDIVQLIPTAAEIVRTRIDNAAQAIPVIV